MDIKFYQDFLIKAEKTEGLSFISLFNDFMNTHADLEEEETETFICITKHKEGTEGNIKFFDELNENLLNIARKYNIKTIKVNPTPETATRRHNGYYYPICKSLKQTLFFQGKFKQLAFKCYDMKYKRKPLTIDWTTV